MQFLFMDLFLFAFCHFDEIFIDMFFVLFYRETLFDDIGRVEATGNENGFSG